MKKNINDHQTVNSIVNNINCSDGNINMLDKNNNINLKKNNSEVLYNINNILNNSKENLIDFKSPKTKKLDKLEKSTLFINFSSKNKNDENRFSNQKPINYFNNNNKNENKDVLIIDKNENSLHKHKFSPILKKKVLKNKIIINQNNSNIIKYNHKENNVPIKRKQSKILSLNYDNIDNYNTSQSDGTTYSKKKLKILRRKVLKPVSYKNDEECNGNNFYLDLIYSENLSSKEFNYNEVKSINYNIRPDDISYFSNIQDESFSKYQRKEKQGSTSVYSKKVKFSKSIQILKDYDDLNYLESDIREIKSNNNTYNPKYLDLKEIMSDMLFCKFNTFLKLKSITNQIFNVNLVLKFGINKKKFLKLRLTKKFK